MAEINLPREKSAGFGFRASGLGKHAARAEEISSCYINRKADESRLKVTWSPKSAEILG